MHIKYITNVRIPTSRAHGYAIMKMCSEFAKAGVKTSLFVPARDNNQNKKDPFEFYKIEKNFKIEKIPSFDLLARTERFGKVFYWIDILSFLLSFKIKVKINKDDILYTRDFVTASFFSKKNFIVLELHSIPKSKFLFNLAVKKVSKFVVLSSSIKNTLISLGVQSQNILISPSGVDLKNFEVQTNNPQNPKGYTFGMGDFVYGYIGTLKTMGMEKGVLDCLKALTFLPANYKFLIVGGEEEDVEYYKKISINWGVSEKVIFIGQVPQPEVSGFISFCDVLVAPYPQNKHYSLFMSPLKIFEYMASKKPIIATDLPTLREILVDGENATLISPENPKALANAIIFIKENPDYAKRIREKAYEDVRDKYTWQKRVENILSFIKNKI